MAVAVHLTLNQQMLNLGLNPQEGVVTEWKVRLHQGINGMQVQKGVGLLMSIKTISK